MDVRNTLAVSLWAGQQRGAVPNSATLSFRAQRAPASARGLFLGAYASFADKCREIEEPGLAIVAIDEQSGRASGFLRLLARVQRPVAAIIGRHDRADLFLASNAELALRHLAVVLEPVTNWQRGSTNVRYRFLDLRTSEGMVGENGKRLRGFVAEGPAIMRCGGYTLFALPLGDPSDWPVSPEDAWKMLPQREYIDEVAGGTSRVQLAPIVQVPQFRPRQTFITATHGPRDSSEPLVHADGGDAVGMLELATANRGLSLRIGERALADGVLVGRYDRCDTAVMAQEDNSLSRVHALLMRIENRLMLIDTASTNGTFANNDRVRFVLIEPGVEIRLGKRTMLRWVPFDA